MFDIVIGVKCVTTMKNIAFEGTTDLEISYEEGICNLISFSLSSTVKMFSLSIFHL